MPKQLPVCGRVAAAILVIVALPRCASSQWNTPTVDGTIESGEYGGTANGSNQIGTGGQTWYMTWDNTNLYVGIANANTGEAAVIYIGTGASGTTAGNTYDNTDPSPLPFPAQFVTYFKDGYHEFRTSNGGAWSNANSNFGTYASSSGTREFAIPWSAVTGSGLPAQFNFLGYVTSSSGYVYGQVPVDNGGGSSPTYTQYYSIANTGNGSSTPPFSSEDPVTGGFSGADKAGFFHNTFDPFYRSSEGAATENTQVTLRFRTLHSTGVSAVDLRAYLFDTATANTAGPVDTNMPFDQNITVNGTEYDVWKTTVTMPSTPTVYYYKFHITEGGISGFYSDDYLDDYDNLNKGGTGTASDTEPFNSFQITVYDPNFQTPAWMANANIYHIFPDRFRQGNPSNQYCVSGSTSGCPSFYGAPPSSNIAVTPWNTLLCDPNDPKGDCYNNFGSIFYGGDLLGIQNELDYIQGMGFDTLYLNPIFYGNSNHRYDTDDFLNIDPALGGNAAFTSLVNEMNHRGMQVILDGTFEDASSDSTYFNEYNKFPTVGACQSLSSPWRTWFQFLDSTTPCSTSDYTGWDGFSSLPLVDPSQPAVQQFFFSGTPDNVMLHWYNAGAGGWRFDSAPNIPNYFWHALRPYAKSYNPNGPLIGEIWPNASQWLAGDQMDSTMNYRFRRNVTGFARGQYGWVDDNDNGNDSIIPLTPSQFDTANRAVRDDYPPQATAAMMNMIDSHDTNRALYVLTEENDSGLTQAKQRLELAAIFQFTYIGAPTVFYGDEAAINAPSRYSGPNGPAGDPYARAPYPWTDQAGDATTYGPPDQSVIAFYTQLGHMRKQFPALSSGSFVTLLTGDTQQASNAPNTYAYARVGPNNQVAIVALNNGSNTNTPSIPVSTWYSDGTTLQDALSGNTYTVSGGNVSLTLNPISGVILLPDPAAVDLTPPTGSIGLTPPANGNGWINSSPVTANISASDGSGSGVSQLRYWVDNGAAQSTPTTSASPSVSGEGQHTVGARAIDNAGNISALISAAVNIDLTPPVVTVTGVTNGATYSSGSVPQAGCQTTDALSGVQVNATVSVTGGNQGSGAYTATCSGGEDNAGNTANSVSANYTVTAAPAITSANNTSFTVGQSGSFPVTTTGYPTPTLSESGALPSGVSFVDNGNGSGALSWVAGTPAGGVYNISFGAQNGVSPNANQSFTLTVNNATTSVGVSASVSPSAFGQSVTFTATVRGQYGAIKRANGKLHRPDPTGSITWSGWPTASTDCPPTALSGNPGTATCATSSLPVGSDTVTASYAGDGSHSGNSGSVGQTVNQASSGTAVISSLNPSAYGQSVSFTANVSAVGPGAGTPTGAVQFAIDGKNFGSPVALSSGSAASASISTLSAATHTVTAAYSGDTNFSSGSGSLSGGQVVNADVPSVVSASPSPASGLTNTFALAYSDTGGPAALHYLIVDFNTSTAYANACVVYYNQDNNNLSLETDAGNGLTGPIQPGSSSTLSNTQCTIKGAGTTVSTSGNTTTLHLAVTASGSFTGAKSIYMLATDNNGKQSGWQNEGTWTLPASVPSVVSASPGAFNGLSQSFPLTYSDTAGPTHLQYLIVDFNTSTAYANACVVYYNQDNNKLWLENDAGNALMGPVQPGSAPLSNSQCTINATGTSVAPSGNNLILNLSVTASTNFTGTKNIYMLATDNDGKQSGWLNKGTWVPSVPVPSVVSASPSGAGFALTYSDTGGPTHLQYLVVDFNTSTAYAHACVVYYNQENNNLLLENDAGNGFVGVIQPGSGTLSNGQCTITGSNTTVVPSGNNLALNLGVTANGSFTGTKTIYMLATDNDGKQSGWQNKGTWTP
ncbi:MAG: alpha-amylase family glycosyl hydrolase [Bryobacteraceae bacterium]